MTQSSNFTIEFGSAFSSPYVSQQIVFLHSETRQVNGFFELNLNITLSFFSLSNFLSLPSLFFDSTVNRVNDNHYFSVTSSFYVDNLSCVREM
jgi:hypothetical protein